MPYPIFGTITDGGSPVNNANVYAVDTTTPGSTGNTTSNSDGKYNIDLQNIANTNGDNIKVYACDSGKTKQNIFALDISGAAEQVNLALDSTSITEIMAINDPTPTTIEQYYRTIIEQLALLDTPTTQASFIRTVTDIIGLLDDYNINPSIFVTDIINLLEAHTANVSTSTVEQIALLGATIKNIGITRADQIALLESTIKNIAITRTEQIAILDVASTSASKHASVADIIALVETLSLDIAVFITEQMGLNDQTTASNIGHSATDQLALLSSFIKELSMHYAESIALADDAITEGMIEETVVQILGLVDITIKNPSYTIIEKLALIESQIYNIKKSIVEQIAFNDDGYAGLYYTGIENIGLEETIRHYPSIVVTDLIELVTKFTTGNVVEVEEQLGLLKTTFKNANILVAEKVELLDMGNAGNQTVAVEQIALVDAATLSTAIFVSGLISLLESSKKTPHINRTDVLALMETSIKGVNKTVFDIIALVDDVTQSTTGIGAYPTDTLGLTDEVTHFDYLINVFEKMGLLGSHLKDISLTIEEKLEIVDAYNTLAHFVGEYIQSYYASEHKDSDHAEEYKDSDENEVNI